MRSIGRSGHTARMTDTPPLVPVLRRRPRDATDDPRTRIRPGRRARPPWRSATRAGRPSVGAIDADGVRHHFCADHVLEERVLGTERSTRDRAEPPDRRRRSSCTLSPTTVEGGGSDVEDGLVRRRRALSARSRLPPISARPGEARSRNAGAVFPATIWCGNPRSRRTTRSRCADTPTTSGHGSCRRGDIARGGTRTGGSIGCCSRRTPRARSRSLPEFQCLAVGDHVPDGPPESGCYFVVERMEAPHLLVLRSHTHLPPKPDDAWLDWVWTWAIDDLEDGRVRVHLRTRGAMRTSVAGPRVSGSARGPTS